MELVSRLFGNLIFYKSGKTGFTLIEFLLVTSITGIIAVVVFANLGQGERNLAVNRSAQQIAAALREAQNMSLGGEAVGATPTTPEGGFGVYFQVGESPLLFADFNESHTYQAAQIPPEEQRTIYLDAGVTVSVVSHQHVVFFPPNPDVYLNGLLAPGDTLITVQKGSSISRVRVSQLGNISIE